MAIILAPSAALALSTSAKVTIEAEYGNYVWEGSRFTAAHHQTDGPFCGDHCGGTQPSPCNNPDIPAVGPDDVIGVSHFDLDTLGGVLRAVGAEEFFQEDFAAFWELAGFVDVKGPHRLGDSGASDEDLERLHAFWAWGQENRLPRYEEVTDVTSFFLKATAALWEILRGGEEVLEKGRRLKAASYKLNADSHVQTDGAVVVRAWPGFTNHLYVDPQGVVGKAVVAFRMDFKYITISFAEEPEGVTAKEIVQALWGPEAGGHPAIAGSPRERKMAVSDLAAAVEAVKAALNS
jgi:hypothetical protein